MAENLTQNQIITIAGRKKMLRARAGDLVMVVWMQMEMLSHRWRQNQN